MEVTSDLLAGPYRKGRFMHPWVTNGTHIGNGIVGSRYWLKVQLFSDAKLPSSLCPCHILPGAKPKAAGAIRCFREPAPVTRRVATNLFVRQIEITRCYGAGFLAARRAAELSPEPRKRDSRNQPEERLTSVTRDNVGCRTDFHPTFCSTLVHRAVINFASLLTTSLLFHVKFCVNFYWWPAPRRGQGPARFNLNFSVPARRDGETRLPAASWSFLDDWIRCIWRHVATLHVSRVVFLPILLVITCYVNAAS